MNIDKILKKNEELYKYFQKIVKKFNKETKSSVDIEDVFYFPAKRKEFLISCLDIVPEMVTIYLGKENELENLQNSLRIELEELSKLSDDLKKQEFPAEEQLDKIFKCATAAYDYYSSSFKDLTFSVNMDKSSDSVISLSSREMDNTFYNNIGIEMGILDRNIAHCLGIKENKGQNDEEKKQGVPLEPTIFNQLYQIFNHSLPGEDLKFVQFVLKKCPDYLKYLLYGTGNVTDEEKINLDKYKNDEDIKSRLQYAVLKDIPLKSSAFLLFVKYKYLPEVILDYDLRGKSDNNKGRDLSIVTSAGGNANFLIPSYDISLEPPCRVLTSYCSLISIVYLVKNSLKDEKLVEQLREQNPQKPKTNHIKDLKKLQSLLEDGINTSKNNLSKANKILNEFNFSMNHHSRLINYGLLYEIALELIFGESFDCRIELVDKEFDDGTISKSIEESLKKYASNNFILENEKRAKDSNFSSLFAWLGKKIDANTAIQSIELNNLIPLVTYFFNTLFDNNLPMASVLACCFKVSDQDIDYFVKSTQRKTMVQVILDERVQGNSFKIDSIHDSNQIFRLSTINQYEDSILLSDSERLAIKTEKHAKKENNNFKLKILDKLINTMPFILTGGLILSGLSFTKTKYDVNLVSDEVIEQNIDLPQDNLFVSEGTKFYDSSDYKYRNDSVYGIVDKTDYYKADGVSIIYDGNIIYSSFDLNDNTDEDISNLLGLYDVNDLEVYYHIKYPSGGWILKDNLLNCNFTDTSIIKTEYSATTDYNDNVITIKRNNKDVYIDLKDENGKLYKPGDSVYDNENTEYVITNMNIIEEKNNIIDQFGKINEITSYKIEYDFELSQIILGLLDVAALQTKLENDHKKGRKR